MNSVTIPCVFLCVFISFSIVLNIPIYIGNGFFKYIIISFGEMRCWYICLILSLFSVSAFLSRSTCVCLTPTLHLLYLAFFKSCLIVSSSLPYVHVDDIVKDKIAFLNHNFWFWVYHPKLAFFLNLQILYLNRQCRKFVNVKK